MGKMKIRIKKPSKQTIVRDIRRAVTKNLKCPNCGSSMPTTTMSSSRCSKCGFTLKMN